jgi:hypothetical protein
MIQQVKIGKLDNRLAKTLSIMICAALLSAAFLGSARHVYAQDAAETDENIGSWNGPDANSAEQSIGDAKKHALSIKGCWAGSVMDTGDGTGTATLHFNQNSSRKKLLLGSEFDFEWPGMVFVRGPMKGTVTATGFNFTSKAVDQGKVCTVSGSGTGDGTMLTGTVVFGEYCATVSLFQNVTFSITPGCP